MSLSPNDRMLIAEEFLSKFYGDQIYVSKFDPPNANGYDLKEVDKKPWHYYGRFDEVYEKLHNVNNPTFARGIFFCVNELQKSLDSTRKRTNRMWVRSRAIWCEDDNIRSADPNDFRSDWPIVPNLVVNTSPGKFHYYWLTNIDDQDSWQCVQNHMVQNYGSDKSVKDLARILRIPGFYHLKDPEHAHLVNYVELKKDPYTWQEILEAYPPEEIPGNTKKDRDKNIEKAKRERVFIRQNSVLDALTDLELVKGRLEVGTWDITCPWIKQHTNEEDSGTRFFQAHYNGYDQDNFKCNHAHCADRKISDLVDKLRIEERERIPKYILDDADIKANIRPDFPADFMLDWPDPWPLIWRNWKKIPRELSQPLLVPTILSLHAYILNSKYITEWGRRPNLYQLNLAESTANKDTNSKDVLRIISDVLTEMNIHNTIFNPDLFNADSNITSDTAFLKMLEGNGGNFYWMNTEATRVFQQLNSSSGSNSSVMALADKMIEVVDGHGITSKAKADTKVRGCSDPNVQIVFYAQPETIERYIGPEMVDSGFLGRAIITIDDKNLIGAKPNLFIRRTDSNKNIDEELARFYASRSIGSAIKEVYVVAPDERGMEELTDWSESFIHPMLEEVKSENTSMYKMLSRIGNTAEQLYAIIIGICREWDIFKGEDPRTAIDISPSCMFSLLEFWSKSKKYVVNEYIAVDSDPIAMTVENVLLKYIKGKIKIEEEYQEILTNRGLIPRSILIRAMRNQGKLKRQLNMRQDLFIVKVNMVIDTLIANDVLREEFSAKANRLVKAKKTKYVGFA